MPKTCCCGCFILSTGTAVALSFCAVQALIGLLWNIQVLFLINADERFNHPLDGVINIEFVDDLDVVHGLILAAIILNILWLLFAIIGARGNATLQAGRLVFWDMLTIIISVFDFAATIFFAVRLQALSPDSDEFFLNSKPTKSLTYLTLLVAFSKGGFMIFFNIYLAHVVQMRVKEISANRSDLASYIIDTTPVPPNKTVRNNNALPRTEPPPAYASSSPYSVPPPPTSRNENRSDSSGSQWSLSYEAIQNMSGKPPKYEPPVGKKKCTIEMARALSKESCVETEEVTIETNTSAVVP
ncbi:uncharacterized protein TNIN_65731 [Trichonephila inaurata madagascariensis]|uniref:Uncharacterized protein n=1 Tax=Trichonephila inaurata madagascariensis TaxID=2747483 RepID=A0A8X7CEM6_9ARAC|nr:uncharacterized protein TNIN_65731 [Trichonephila inaurata madagascariensis]